MQVEGKSETKNKKPPKGVDEDNLFLSFKDQAINHLAIHLPKYIISSFVALLILIFYLINILINNFDFSFRIKNDIAEMQARISQFEKIENRIKVLECQNDKIVENSKKKILREVNSCKNK